MKTKILDHGYVEFIEDWGRGTTSQQEAGIIEAARQSTQGSFRQWDKYFLCEKCDEWWVGLSIASDIGKCKVTGASHVIKEYPRGDMGLLSFLFTGKPQHATPFEFCGMVIEVQAPIFVFREWHRHRTQSYNEMSARYAPIPNNNYIPTVDRCLMVGGKNRQAGALVGSDQVTHESALEWLEELAEVYDHAEKVYQSGLKRGIPKEVARIPVPVGRYTRMRACANLRNWLAFMTLRADPAAQWEIQQFAHEVGNIISQHFPRTWSLYIEGKK